MKKTLALLLALIMILSVSLVACSTGDNNPGNNDDDGFEDDDDGFVNIGGNNTQTEDTDTDTGNLGGWENVSVTIYVLGNGLNIRSEADDSTTENILGKAKIGDSFVATASDDDWYKITYNGKEAYVSADYVTINQAEAVFEECTPETLKIKEEVVDKDATKDIDKYAKVMLRTDPVVIDKTATTNVLIYKNTTGDELVKIGANKAGTWYKVTYGGGTYYIASGAFKYFVGYTDGNAGGLG